MCFLPAKNELINFADMKKLSAILFALALAAGIPAAADVQWLETSHDFGAFDEDLGPATCEFKFVNTSDAPVSILAARASCGCTSPKYSREPVAPGDTATVTVTYDPAGRPGRFSKYVAVDISDNPRVKLIVKGTVVGSAQSVERRFPVTGPAGLKMQRGAVMFGQVKKGHTRTATLDMYNRSTEPVELSAKDLPGHIKVTFEPAVLAPGEQATAIFYFNSGRCPEYGLVNDTINVLTSAGAEPFALPSVAIVEEDFSKLTAKELAKAPVATVESTSLDFGKLPKNEKVTRTVTLKNNGKSALAVRRIYSTDAGVEVSIDRTTVKPGKTATITATVDPEQLKGALLNARAALVTNDPSASTQTIRLVGTLD